MISTASTAILIVGALAATGAALLSPPQEHVVSSYATSLQGRNRSQRHNAVRAIQKLSGAVIRPGETFSFNACVGSFSRDDGYRKAPVSYNGQLIDSWGGGVCQSSTTLYNAALLAGMQIVERHRHEFCPSYVPPGLDAAVAFSEIDLKFRNPLDYPVRLKATTTDDLVRVDFLAETSPREPIRIVQDVYDVQRPSEFTLGHRGRGGRIRNSGKAGYDVSVYRVQGKRRELISTDNYPAMNRVVDFGG